MDIAQLGIKLDTNDINAGIQQLKKISPTAKVAEQASASMGVAMRNSSVIFAKATELMVRGMLALAQANGNASSATIKNLKDVANQAKMLTQAANAQQVLKTNTEQATAAITKQTIALKAAVSTTNAFNAVGTRTGGRNGISGDFRFKGMPVGGGFGGTSPTRDLAPNRFNTGNIAAQFQDIGVTAAMGMNPLTIAIQQGTQLSAVLQTMESPLQGIKAAFVQIINPTALLSIALVGLVAAGLQMVDWTSVASGASEMLANSLDVLVAAFAALSVVMVASKWSAITTAIGAMIPVVIGAAKAVGLFTAALLTNPMTLLAVGVAAVTGGLLYLTGVTDKLKESLRGVNKEVEDLNEKFDKNISKLIDQQQELTLTGDALVRFKNEQRLLRAEEEILATGMERTNSEFKRRVMIQASLMKGVETAEQIKTTREFNEQLEQRITLMGLEKKAAIENTLESKKQLEFERLKQQALSRGALIDEKRLRNAADLIVKAQERPTIKTPTMNVDVPDPFLGIESSALRNVTNLKKQTEAIMEGEKAVNLLRIETQLLDQAADQGIRDPEQIERLKSIAAETAAIEEKNRQLTESYQFMTTTTTGFFQSLKSGISEGKSLWESFADAAVNALNKILDKILELSVESMFESTGSSIFGDILGGIFGGVASGGGSLGSDALAAAGGPSMIGVKPFAKGGAFTNSIASSPTLFKFANGGSFGVMGEAGPEAVLPLQRGSDGSLGVKMYDNDNTSTAAPAVVINQTINVSTGVVPTVRAEIMSLMPVIQENAKQGVIDAQSRGAM